jgi:GT2 family glycosyltransferase
VLTLPQNVGFVNALNEIIPLATGDRAIIMHLDVELLDGCIQALDDFMEAHPSAAVVSPDLYYPDGQPNKIRTQFPKVSLSLKRVLNKLLFITTRRKLSDDEVLWDHSSDVSVDMVMSVCMMFRKQVLQEIGRVDPRLFFYYSNDYLCGRARQLGWTCHYTRNARAIHFERFTPTEDYSGSDLMTYKKSTVAANPRMRADFFVFLSHFYSLHTRLAFRALAMTEDLIELLAHLTHSEKRQQNVSSQWRSVLIDLGMRNV